MDLAAVLKETFEGLRSRPLQPVEVAVVDSGIDATHPDLAGRVGSAYRIEQVGDRQEVVQGSAAENADRFGHGTSVAGIIAQMAPNARLTDIRVLNEQNMATGETLVAGFRLAVESPVRLINLSLACRAKFAPQLHELCEAAYRNNQVVVAAKRNMPLVDNGFPAELSSCISVDLDAFPSSYMVRYRRNDVIEFVGRGEGVIAAAPGGGYTERTGTSFATPAVTALCALLIGAYPDLRPFELKTILKAFSV